MMYHPRMNPMQTRRQFLGTCALGCLSAQSIVGQQPAVGQGRGGSLEPVIDIHQHTWYLGRTDDELIRHQDIMGVSRTILLPAGRSVVRDSVHEGRSNGLDATVLGNREAYELTAKHPDKFIFFANEIPDLPDTRRVLEYWLRRGARGIGEQKFNVPVDSPAMRLIYEVAREFNVPVLMHFQNGMYNHDLLRFHKILDEYSDVNFIGHAQTWWGNIDRNHDQKVMYPPGTVTPGGVTDQLLSNHDNMYGDHSAGSGLNALIRDEDHARGFLERHQDQLLFGSDCPDKLGVGPGCKGAQILKAIRGLSPTPDIARKILSGNASRLFRIPT